MANKKFLLRIITPAEVKIDEEVDMVIMRSTNGDVGILAGHESRSFALDYGITRILNDGEERRIGTFGGFAIMQDNLLTISTSNAEWPEDIDRIQAEADREHAELDLKEKLDDTGLQSAKLLLRRSLVQIEVSSYSIINKQTEEEK